MDIDSSHFLCYLITVFSVEPFRILNKRLNGKEALENSVKSDAEGARPAMQAESLRQKDRADIFTPVFLQAYSLSE